MRESRTILPMASTTDAIAQRPRSWRQRIDGEPPLAELLNDPTTQLLMRRDGVTSESLESTVKQAQAVLRKAEKGARRAA